MRNEETKPNVSATELERQQAIIEEIRLINDEYYKETGKKRCFYNFVMGCQMNARDSEKLAGMLTEMGYIETENEKEADFVIYNTCCVRENAENKVYGNLGYLKNYKSKKPDMIIALCGCMMQQPTVIQTIKKKYRHVDIVFGTFNLYKLPELLKTRLETGHTIFDIWETHEEIIEDLPSIRKKKFKASVNIMFGCNNFCTYCIVPYVRGRERSRKKEDIIAEIKALVADGVKEVMLLGQNVNSYGKNLEEPVTFAELLREINEIEGLERIRFMTSHPKDLSDELIYAMRDCDKVSKALHLPFQAGSNAVLERMNRRYTKEGYLALIDKLKKEIPDILLTTDIIVGFPGETEEDFEHTLDVVRKVGYSSAFTFIYSKRTGTPAAEYEDQIPEDVTKNRFNRLLTLVNNMVHDVNEKFIGQTMPVLVEEQSKNSKNMVTGRTPNNLLVHFEGDANLIGTVVDVKLTENKSFYIIGERN
ncbi:MAG: tRNA (N6-isopentenyl adenosine(37)-C2)-methylthiotransferase MiaB [Firmicutes bacterium]|nr:tRNA (N6-isopentenyl adenosine(37)-C2)-methylthiotransferase MiaB [Bacillota bacterium]